MVKEENKLSVAQLDLCLAAAHDEVSRLQSGGHGERPSVRAKIKACLERVLEISNELEARKQACRAK
jgi:hypothetical protein